MDKLLQEFKNHVSGIAWQLERDGAFKNRKKLHRSDQTFLGQVLNKKLDDSGWPTALFKLTRLLHTLHGKEVVLLMDEYDTSTWYAIQHGYFPVVHLIPY